MLDEIAVQGKINYAESSISTKSKEQDECLDGFVPRNDAMRLFFGGFLFSLLRRASSQ